MGTNMCLPVKLKKQERKKMAITNDTAKEIIDRKEAANILSVSLTQIERFRRMGILPYIKLSHKCVRYRRSDCEKLLEACTVKNGIGKN